MLLLISLLTTFHRESKLIDWCIIDIYTFKEFMFCSYYINDGCVIDISVYK